MRFKVDENLPLEFVSRLKAAGHEATTVNEEDLKGAKDPRIAAVCRNEGRILMTLDLGFADVREYRPGEHPGLIVLRGRSQAKTAVFRQLQSVLSLIETEPVDGRLWIVEDSRIRIRE